MTTKTKVAVASALVFVASWTTWSLRSKRPDHAPVESAARAATPVPVKVALSPAVPEAVRLEEPASSDEPVPSSARTPPTEPTEKCSIEGIVRTASGAPVESALVFVEPGKASSQSFVQMGDLGAYLKELLGPPSPGRRAIARTTTATDGSFRFDELTLGSTVDVVAIERNEGMGVVTDVRLDPARPPGSVEVTLRGGVVLHGTVRDRLGVPIAGACVGGSVWIGEGEGRFGLPAQFASTAADGSYRSPPLPYRRFTFECSARGFTVLMSPEMTEVAAGASEHREDFTLERATVLQGRIVLSDGSAPGLDRVEGDLLLVTSSADPEEAIGGPEWLGDRGSIDRDNDRYVTAPLAHELEFVSLWCGARLLGSAKVITPGVGPDVVVDLTRISPPPKTATFALRVVDEETGAAISRFGVTLVRDVGTLLPKADGRQQRDVEAADGVVTFADCPLGDYGLDVRADGFAPRALSATVTEEISIPPMVVALKRGTASLSGSVVDESGTAISGAEVCLFTPDGIVALPFPECFKKSDDVGDFDFADIPEGDYVLVGSAKARAPVATSARGGTRKIVITLITGTVVRFRPSRAGREPSYLAGSLRIRDDRGVPILDQHTLARSIIAAGHEFPVQLTPGRYSVEFLAAGHHSLPTRFVAAPDSIVPIELVKDSVPGSQR